VTTTCLYVDEQRWDAMAQVTVENPYIHQKKKVDDRGRVYVANELCGEKVRITVEVVEPNE